ncbi:nuclear transport factor 2 family protein [Phytoactinopolyspora halotolerans]|uniref:nuclear transport factor 2 family protein n=1 Tax=Phytoactinopolyspora halotolerans TaxID=1981512 RepID=UPI001C20B5F9|nr:nuclear transport factor 2 family protein [Phytoactinopolyspora halotolerans]
MAAEDRLPSALGGFIDAVNAHDEEAFLGAFTEDGLVNDWGREFRGREAIKGWSDREFIGARGTMTVTDVAEDAGWYQVTADWRSTHANGLSLFEFQLDGDHISVMRISEAQA